MTYDVDAVIDRKNTSCLKFDFAAKYGFSEDAIPMWVADMDFRTLPPIVEALRARVDHGVFGYTAPQDDYFETVCGWFRRRHGWDPRPDAFVPVCSVVFAISTLLTTVTEVGDPVVICQPVYYPFEKVIRENGRKLVVSELKYENGRYEMDFEDFERKIRENGVKAFILCSPHNPVGRVWTREELVRMADICMKYGVFVISDEIHADFVFRGKHVVFPEAKPEYAHRVAVCTAPTKTFNLAGLKISNLYIPDDGVRAAYRSRLSALGFDDPNVMGITACKVAYREGDAWLEALKSYLSDNLACIRGYLAEHLPELRLVEPEGTYLAWVDCRSLGLSDDALGALMGEKARLWLDDGYIFGKGGSGFVRINYACPRTTLMTALGRLGAALEERK